MLSMASKKGKRESILAVGEWACLHVHILPSLSTYQQRKHYCFLLDTLKELWVSDLLPEERKLKSLKQVISSLDHVISDSPIIFVGLKKKWPLFLCVQQRPLNLLVANGHSARVRHRMLLLWYYEDQLKNKYSQFISTLQVCVYQLNCTHKFLETKWPSICSDVKSHWKLLTVTDILMLALFPGCSQSLSLRAQLEDKIRAWSGNGATVISLSSFYLLNNLINDRGSHLTRWCTSERRWWGTSLTFSTRSQSRSRRFSPSWWTSWETRSEGWPPRQCCSCWSFVSGGS